eukprot:TRINITY_DN18267_c0_g1_i1.p1 TRINITY_DN18267_c0_g1~~TRINITY_DN18267_c0_g1_i1.p1  ORF type:complete len:866 (+),score=218.65 TRINITY_DN18267_c0_g1_i1:133-2730(+)
MPCLCGAQDDVEAVQPYYERATLIANDCVMNETVEVKYSRKKKGNLNGYKSINNYKVQRPLGEGRFGEVFLCTSPRPGSWMPACLRSKPEQQFAIKIVERRHAAIEYKILLKVQHKNIVRLLEYINDPSNDKLFLVFEVLGKPVATLTHDGHLQGGEDALWDEPKARNLFKQMIDAVQHLHNLGVFHRDIKPENIVFAAHDTNHIKILDFGESRMLKKGQYGDDSCRKDKGTPFFQPPESLTGQYHPDKCVDVWALGVMFYLVLIGYVPFGRGATHRMELYNALRNDTHELEFPPRFDGKRVKDLLESMLNRDLTRRMTLPAVSNHVWFSSGDRHLSRCSLHSSMNGNSTPSDFAGIVEEPDGLPPGGLVLVEPAYPEGHDVNPCDWSFRSATGMPTLGLSGDSGPDRGHCHWNSDDYRNTNPLSPGAAVLRRNEHKNASTYTRPDDMNGSASRELEPAEVEGASPYDASLEQSQVAASPLGKLMSARVPRLLVVDDIHYGRYILCRMLQKIAIPPDTGGSALTLFEAVSGRSAINGTLKEARNGTPYDLVILDLFLPDMHGLVALREIRDKEKAENLNQTPIIIATSAEEQPHDIKNKVESLSARLLVKPVSIQQAAKLVKWLGVRTHSDVETSELAQSIARPRHLADSHYLANSMARSYSESCVHPVAVGGDRLDLTPGSVHVDSVTTTDLGTQTQPIRKPNAMALPSAANGVTGSASCTDHTATSGLDTTLIESEAEELTVEPVDSSGHAVKQGTHAGRNVNSGDADAQVFTRQRSHSWSHRHTDGEYQLTSPSRDGGIHYLNALLPSVPSSLPTAVSAVPEQSIRQIPESILSGDAIPGLDRQEDSMSSISHSFSPISPPT